MKRSSIVTLVKLVTLITLAALAALMYLPPAEGVVTDGALRDDAPAADAAPAPIGVGADAGGAVGGGDAEADPFETAASRNDAATAHPRPGPTAARADAEIGPFETAGPRNDAPALDTASAAIVARPDVEGEDDDEGDAEVDSFETSGANVLLDTLADLERFWPGVTPLEARRLDALATSLALASAAETGDPVRAVVARGAAVVLRIADATIARAAEEASCAGASAVGGGSRPESFREGLGRGAPAAAFGAAAKAPDEKPTATDARLARALRDVRRSVREFGSRLARLEEHLRDPPPPALQPDERPALTTANPSPAAEGAADGAHDVDHDAGEHARLRPGGPAQRCPSPRLARALAEACARDLRACRGGAQGRVDPHERPRAPESL